MRTLFSFVAIFGCVLPAHAQMHVSGTITNLRTGWEADQFGVVIDAPQINPASCANATLGYVSNINQPGYHTFYAAALTAYVARRPITIAVHTTQCIGPFVKIIGINMP